MVVAMVAGAFFWGKRRSRRDQSGEKYAPPYPGPPNAAHGAYGYYLPPELGGVMKHPLHEAGDYGREKVHELGTSRMV